jgi:hypothetical protein
VGQKFANCVAVNNSVHSATGTNPFLMDRGQAPLAHKMSPLAAARKDIFPLVGNWRSTVKAVKARCTMHSIATKKVDVLQTRSSNLGPSIYPCLPKNLKYLLSKSHVADPVRTGMQTNAAFPWAFDCPGASGEGCILHRSLLHEVHPVFHPEPFQCKKNFLPHREVANLKSLRAKHTLK